MPYSRAQRDIDKQWRVRKTIEQPGARRCQTDFCVLNVTAKGPLPAPFVVALARAHSRVSQLALVKNATEAAMSVAIFVAVVAKWIGKLNLIQPKRRRVDSTSGTEHCSWLD